MDYVGIIFPHSLLTGKIIASVTIISIVIEILFLRLLRLNLE